MSTELTIQVPVALPAPEEVREIIRTAALDVAARQLAWLSYDEAAKHCGWCKKTFERKRKKYGLPVSEIDGTKRVLRADVDALLLLNSTTPGASVIVFPSAKLRADLLLKGAA